jgi:chromosome segregation ATPase
VQQLEVRLEQHLDEAEARFEAVVQRMNRADEERAEILKVVKALEETERSHDALLHQVNGGIKTVRFLGWLITGGVFATLLGWFRKVTGTE